MRERKRRANELSRSVARIQAAVLALVFGLMGGAGLFLMTVWLLLKGGAEVGPHLRLLSNYFPGYSVTWMGSLVGFFWGALVGALVGWTIGTVYNRIVGIRFPSERGTRKDER
jgi:hypothetical protein